jgi:hypothetical protein
VRLGDGVLTDPRICFKLPSVWPMRLALRVGKRLKIAVIQP